MKTKDLRLKKKVKQTRKIGRENGSSLMHDKESLPLDN